MAEGDAYRTNGNSSNGNSSSSSNGGSVSGGRKKAQAPLFVLSDWHNNVEVMKDEAMIW